LIDSFSVVDGSAMDFIYYFYICLILFPKPVTNILQYPLGAINCWD